MYLDKCVLLKFDDSKILWSFYQFVMLQFVFHFDVSASTLNSSNSVSNRVFDSKSMAVTHGNLGLNIDVGSGSGVEVGQDESVRRMALHALLKEFCEESLSANQLRHALGMFVVFGIIDCLCLK